MLLIVCSRIEACVFAVQTALRAGHHAHPYSALLELAIRRRPEFEF
jgi:hypothetical protein